MKVNYDRDLSDVVKEQIIFDYKVNLLSVRDIVRKYNVKSKTYLTEKLLKNVLRTNAEGNRIIHKMHPEIFKHSEESIKKIRQARLKFMQEHPEQTAWRLKNMSYPEKCFKEILTEMEFDKKFLIIREYPVFPYYIDYAFIDIKIAVEIDGSQHLEPERQKQDKLKDKLLVDNGWRIIRFTAIDVMRDKEKVKKTLKRFIDTNETYVKVGILKYCSNKNVKKERGEDGLTEKQRERAFKQRKVQNRPSKEKLWEMIHTKSFEKIGRMYGVCGGTIKKWCKFYGLPYLKRDINE